MSNRKSLSVSAWVFAVAAMVLSATVASGETFRHYEGEHIRLTIDVGTPQDAEAYVAAFDAATDQWAAFWNLAPERVQAWKVHAVVMSDRRAAATAGWIDATVPEFRYGYAMGNALFVFAQPSQYYTRHLLLHEGVHALAFEAFGGTGPAWFMEGTAEWLATHQDQGNDVTVRRIPSSRESSPHWGRLKIIQDQRASGTIPSLETIMRYPPRLDGDVTAYSWSWAAVMLFSEHPEYRKAYHAATIAGHDASSQLTRELYQRLLPEWPAIVARFRLMAHSLDYGFDWTRERVEISSRDPLWNQQPLSLEIPADHGWQSAGIQFSADTPLRIRAIGEAVLAAEPKPWLSEPSGVTIRYHEGRPLGQLVGCLVPVNYPRSASLPVLETFEIGHDTTLVIDQPSWLVVRVNDAVGELGDNSGTYQVRIEAAR